MYIRVYHSTDFTCSAKGVQSSTKKVSLKIFHYNAIKSYRFSHCCGYTPNKTFGAGFTDKFHDEIRLHNSINRWISNNGKTMNRMKFEISVSELKNMTADEICRKSEKLALDYLSR